MGTCALSGQKPFLSPLAVRELPSAPELSSGRHPSLLSSSQKSRDCLLPLADALRLPQQQLALPLRRDHEGEIASSVLKGRRAHRRQRHLSGQEGVKADAVSHLQTMNISVSSE